MEDCLAALGNRKTCVVRELTKIHEEVISGSLAELAERNLQIKGEIVLIIDSAEIPDDKSSSGAEKNIHERFAELEKEFDRKIALKMAAKEFGMGKSEAYRILQIKK